MALPVIQCQRVAAVGTKDLPMFFDLIASKTFPPSFSGEDVTAPAVCGRGTILLDVAVRADATLMAPTDTNGRITLPFRAGRLDGEQVLGAVGRSEEPSEARSAGGIQCQVLNAEDALDLDDNHLHTIAVTVNEIGTHFYVDDYECFSATLTGFLVQIGSIEVCIDPDGIVAVTRLVAWGESFSDRVVMAQLLPATPLVQFAASEFSTRDTRRTGALVAGSIRASLRTRDRGQADTTIAVNGQGGILRPDTDAGSLNYRVLPSEDSLEIEPLIEVRAPGHWDDGTWHDVVVTLGRGAVKIHVDGYQVALVPGGAFLTDIAPVIRVVVSANPDGRCLFGEVQTAMIYDVALTDVQVRRLAGVASLPTRALFDTGYHGVRSYWTPSLLTPDSGVILAGVNQRVSVPNDVPNDVNLVIRRSPDGGATWEEMRILLSLPDIGALGASLIDSVLVRDHPIGRVICPVGQFPGGIGQPNVAVSTGFDEQGRRVLHSRAGEFFAVGPDGSVATEIGEATDYRVILSGDDVAGVCTGDVLRGSRVADSIYLAYEQVPEDCLFQHRDSHLLTLASGDDGATWSEPVNITAQVKVDWMCSLGTGPGNTIQLTALEYARHTLASVYHSHETGGTAYLPHVTIYSDDGGVVWALSASPNNGREVMGAVVHSRYLADERASPYESVLVEGTDGVVYVWVRSQHPSGRVAHVVSHDGGATWGEVDYDAQLPEIFSQPNTIVITGLEGVAAAGDGDGVKGAADRGIVFTNASRMLPFHGCGVLRLSYDDGVTWSHN